MMKNIRETHALPAEPIPGSRIAGDKTRLITSPGEDTGCNGGTGRSVTLSHAGRRSLHLCSRFTAKFQHLLQRSNSQKQRLFYRYLYR